MADIQMGNKKHNYSLNYIAKIVGAEILHCQHPETIDINALSAFETAQEHQLTFLSAKQTNSKLNTALEQAQAGAVIVARGFLNDGANVNCSVPLLLVDDPYLAYAQVSELFAFSSAFSGVHTSASVDANAILGDGVSIGANAVVAENVVIGEQTKIGPGVVVEAGVTIGSHCCIASNVSIYHHCCLGNKVTVHSGTVIGADGFGFAPITNGDKKAGWQKIHQLGRVVIGDNVEIGANTTIDRGAIDDTCIANGVIIDNQVQIAHNVSIGKNTAIAACTGIAGSTHIGSNCTIAGAVGIVGHLTIVDNVHVTAMSLVTGSITEPGSYSGGTGIAPTREWKKNAVRFGQLDALARRIKALE